MNDSSKGLWLAPLISSLATLALFTITVSIDALAAEGRINLPLWLSVGDINDARAMVGAILGPVATVLALIFSVSLLVLSMAMSHFGPRLMSRFLRDRSMQFTIALFVATFLQSILTFVALHHDASGTFVPQISILSCVVLLLVSFGSLVNYIHRIATSIQTNSVVANIVNDLFHALGDSQKRRIAAAGSGGESVPGISTEQSEREILAIIEKCKTEGAIASAPTTGYIQSIGHLAIVTAAQEAGVVAHLAFRAGQFVMKGEPLARVAPASRLEKIATTLDTNIPIGAHRTLDQDVEFALAQLVEIALRALSSGTNDTFTGIVCIDWLGEALRNFSQLSATDGGWRDDQGAVRIVEPPLRFASAVKAAFDLIRESGANNVAILIRLIQICGRLADQMPDEEHRQPLLRQIEMVWQTASKANLLSSDLEDIRVAYTRARPRLTAHNAAVV